MRLLVTKFTENFTLIGLVVAVRIVRKSLLFFKFQVYHCKVVNS
jgi:hypothetical protein